MTMREHVNGFPVVIVENTCGLRFKWVCIDRTYYVNQQYAQAFNAERERLITKYETADSPMDERLEAYLRSALASRKSDVRLAQIMGDMEKTYDIPMVKRDCKKWLAGSRRNAQVFAIYRCVSGMRSL